MPETRTYDTRTADEIIAQDHFAPYREMPGLDAVPQRELRTFDRFVTWAERQGVESPSVENFLVFVAADRSPRQLENLRLVFDRLLPREATVHQTIREAIRQKNPRSRKCDRRSLEAIIAGAHFEAFRDLPTLTEVPLEKLRVLDRFLIFASARGMDIPTVDDFLEFSIDIGSSRRLGNLYQALDTILPGNPAVLLTLTDAIRRKSPLKPRSRTAVPQRGASYSIPLTALPPDWQETLRALHAGDVLHGFAPLAETTLKSMEEILRHYAHSLLSAGLPVGVSLDGIRAHEVAMRADVQRGSRPATLHTVTTRLRQFGERHGVGDDLIADLRVHENVLRRRLKTVVPAKFRKFHNLPGLRETWLLALALLEEGKATKSRRTALRLRNEAAVLALWSLVPLRLQDGALHWREDVTYSDDRYRIDILTNKTGEPLNGPLHRRLEHFLDVLVLEGVQPDYLEIMRHRAVSARLPLFRRSDGKSLDSGYASTVWRKHMGTGAHIARTRIHTELGRLGPVGVEAALALCAQTDARTKEFYRGEAAKAAEIRRGQDLVEALHDECDGDDGEAFD